MSGRMVEEGASLMFNMLFVEHRDSENLFRKALFRISNGSNLY